MIPLLTIYIKIISLFKNHHIMKILKICSVIFMIIVIIGIYSELRWCNYSEPLWDAANNGDLQTTRKLLEEGADPSSSDIEGTSPLSQVNSYIKQLKKEYNQGNSTISSSKIKRYEMIRSLLIKYGEKE